MSDAPRCCERPDPRPAYPRATGPAARWPLARCANCQQVYLRDPRSLAELDEAQENAYGAPTRRFGGPIEFAIRGFRSARVRLARRWMPAGGAVLDVGCGRGLFLRLLAERGHVVRGTELSEATRRNAYPEVPVDPGS